MERRIGEKFEDNGDRLVVIRGGKCNNCYYYFNGCTDHSVRGECSRLRREKSMEGVIFKQIKEDMDETKIRSAIRVYPEQVQENMKDVIVKTVTEFGKPVTYVTIKMKNGFTIRESTTCVDPDNYDEEVGKKICLKKIEDKIWWLLGYQLQSFIKNDPNPNDGRKIGVLIVNGDKLVGLWMKFDKLWEQFSEELNSDMAFPGKLKFFQNLKEENDIRGEIAVKYFDTYKEASEYDPKKDMQVPFPNEKCYYAMGEIDA